VCGIAIANWEELRKILWEQKDRGLDSVWIINNWSIFRVTASTYRQYKKYLFKKSFKGLTIMHNRKATIWDVNLKNAHPFQWKRFLLAQNGTCRYFHIAHKSTYNQEVDTYNLLLHLEDECNSLEECKIELDRLVNMYMWDDFWNIIIVDRDRILFYSDWFRESFININKEENKIISITNYEPWEKEWYKNVWYLIMDREWIILTNWFKKINTHCYYNKYLSNKTTPLSYNNWYYWWYSNNNWYYWWYSNNNWYYWINEMWIPIQEEIPFSEEEKTTKDFEFSFNEYWEFDYIKEKMNIINFFNKNKLKYIMPNIEDIFDDYMATNWFVYKKELTFEETRDMEYPYDLFETVFDTEWPLYFNI